MVMTHRLATRDDLPELTPLVDASIDELQKHHLGLWRAGRGEYRIRYRIDDEARRIQILDVDHRRDADHR